MVRRGQTVLDNEVCAEPVEFRLTVGLGLRRSNRRSVNSSPFSVNTVLNRIRQSCAWLREAKLPWSTSSVLKIRSKSLSPDQALQRLSRAEATRLAKDRFSAPLANR
jgi:hypothetical protein